MSDLNTRTEWGTRSENGHVEEFGVDEAGARRFATFPGRIVTLTVISRQVQVGPWSDEEAHDA